MKNRNNWFVDLVKNFMFGFIIYYGLITPALNSEISSSLYKNPALSRELLKKATIVLVGSMAIVFTGDPPKSKLIDLDADKQFITQQFKCIHRGVFYTLFFLFLA